MTEPPPTGDQAAALEVYRRGAAVARMACARVEFATGAAAAYGVAVCALTDALFAQHILVQVPAPAEGASIPFCQQDVCPWPCPTVLAWAQAFVDWWARGPLLPAAPGPAVAAAQDPPTAPLPVVPLARYRVQTPGDHT